MRHAGYLVLLIFALLTPRTAFAQSASFRDEDIIQLAAVISSQARRTNQLPSSFSFTAKDGNQTIITAANAFELLSRSLSSWKSQGVFPQSVSLQIPDLIGPEWDEHVEPASDGQIRPVLTADIFTYAAPWLEMAARSGRKLTRAMQLGTTKATSYRLTTAQFLVAMAMLVDESFMRKTVPSVVAVPLVHSPREWLDTQHAVHVRASDAVPAPTQIPTSLRILMNGTDPTQREPVMSGGPGAIPPLCGAMRLDINGFGSVEKIRVVLDKIEYSELSGAGPHTVTIDTLPLADDVHTMAITAFDTQKKSVSYVFSFAVRNGRVSGFNPLKREVDVEPVEEPHP